MSDLTQLQSDLEATEALWKNAQEERDTAWKLVSQYKEANAANLQEVMRLRAHLENAKAICANPTYYPPEIVAAVEAVIHRALKGL